MEHPLSRPSVHPDQNALQNISVMPTESCLIKELVWLNTRKTSVERWSLVFYCYLSFRVILNIIKYTCPTVNQISDFFSSPVWWTKTLAHGEFAAVFHRIINHQDHPITILTTQTTIKIANLLGQTITILTTKTVNPPGPTTTISTTKIRKSLIQVSFHISKCNFKFLN